ncbi:hypothetical protein ACO03_21450 (plasmid) [Pantoea ananatis]|nr:hypothetical protein ACO03_21450 [Pantoea ananatis]
MIYAYLYRLPEHDNCRLFIALLHPYVRPGKLHGAITHPPEAKAGSGRCRIIVSDVIFHKVILNIAVKGQKSFMTCESQPVRDKIAPGAVKYIALSAIFQ